MDTKIPHCPKCHAKDDVRNGKSDGKQRYRCKHAHTFYDSQIRQRNRSLRCSIVFEALFGRIGV
ncbi:MAG: hypothetical protein GDA51_05830 [Ekhidna sp.]|nr:hypothetical protein [Ekhidna sp.]